MRSFNLKQFFLIGFLLFISVAEVLMDYVNAGFDPSVFKDTAYWVELSLSILSVIFVALSARAFARERELNINNEIKGIQKEIKDAHDGLTKRDLITGFEEFVDKRNDERRLGAYTAFLQRRLLFARKKKKQYWAGRIVTAQEDVECFKVIGKHIKVGFRLIKYAPLKTSTIFSGVDISNVDDDDLSGNEAAAVGKMLTRKLSMIIAMSFSFSTLFFTGGAVGLGVIVSTLMKLFRIASSAYTGMSDGAGFIKYNLQDKMQRRLDFVQKFLERERKSKVETEGSGE